MNTENVCKGKRLCFKMQLGYDKKHLCGHVQKTKENKSFLASMTY